MHRRVAILQSNYIPWKGYFDIIRAVDLLVVLDDAQFTKNDWRNRNLIRTRSGLLWLTIPVQTAGRFGQAIDQTVIARPWARRHAETIRQAYAKARNFTTVWPKLAELYQSVAEETMLSNVNTMLLRGLCDMLEINTPFVTARSLGVAGRRGERVLALCRAVGATSYLTGPSARSYLHPRDFEEAGIELLYADYSGYPEYPQVHGGFEHGVSVIDLLLNVGWDAPRYLKRLA